MRCPGLMSRIHLVAVTMLLLCSYYTLTIQLAAVTTLTIHLAVVTTLTIHLAAVSTLTTQLLYTCCTYYT